jgi:hypothetical protein
VTESRPQPYLRRAARVTARPYLATARLLGAQFFHNYEPVHVGLRVALGVLACRIRDAIDPVKAICTRSAFALIDIELQE